MARPCPEDEESGHRRHPPAQVQTPGGLLVASVHGLCRFADSQCCLKIATLRCIWRFEDGRCIKTECCFLEGVGEGGNGQETVFSLFGKGFKNDCINVFGKLWVEGAGGLWLDVKVLVHDLLLSSHKRRTTGEKFVGEDGQSVLVGGIDRFTAPLFGGHVGGGAANSMTGT